MKIKWYSRVNWQRKGVPVTFFFVAVTCFLIFFVWRIVTPMETNQRLHGTIATLKQIREGIELFRADFKRYPSSEEGLQALTIKKNGQRESSYLYIYGPVVDSWGHIFVYRETPGRAHPFALYSVGPNGIDEGGSNDDINYWTITR